MMKRTWFAVSLAFGWILVVSGSARTENWAEKLGYPAGKKVLLLHADDIGMCYETSIAAKEGLSKGHYQSCSVMAPCPWVGEFVAWAKENPQHDVGLHVALNAEWKYYRWGPVAERSKVPGLVDKDGFLHNSIVVTAIRGKGPEVETEIRAQLEKILQMGIKPSHMDSHMGACFAKPEFIEAYLKVSTDTGIPAFVPAPSEKLINRLRKEGTPITPRHVELMENYNGPKIDDFYVLGQAKNYDEKKAQTLSLIESLEPGLTEIIFHPQVESVSSKEITGTWQMRDWESKMWGDADVVKYFADNGIIQTNFKELAKRYQEKFGKGG
jgi:predicted glycoside hydrolase/deacetylase ChbG (UPF0249 family)